VTYGGELKRTRWLLQHEGAVIGSASADEAPPFQPE
jgi:hypothetical protein